MTREHKARSYAHHLALKVEKWAAMRYLLKHRYVPREDLDRDFIQRSDHPEHADRTIPPDRELLAKVGSVMASTETRATRIIDTGFQGNLFQGTYHSPDHAGWLGGKNVHQHLQDGAREFFQKEMMACTDDDIKLFVELARDTERLCCRTLSQAEESRVRFRR